MKCGHFVHLDGLVLQLGFRVNGRITFDYRLMINYKVMSV